MQAKVWHQSDGTWRGIFGLTRPIPLTMKACKIVLFNARRLKLWKGLFEKVSFNTKQKQISLHSHLKTIVNIIYTAPLQRTK